jgi:outer membrane protein TolC
LRQSRSDLVYGVAAAYYNVVLAEEAVRVVDTSVAVATSHVTATEDRYDAGLVSEYDVLRTRVDLTNLETGRRRAEDGRVAATRYLLILLGLPAGTPVALKDRLTFDVERYGLDDSIAAASAARPELRQLELSRLLAEDNVKMARGGDNPTLVFTADYMDYANAYSLNFADDWNDQTTLALSVSWPVFDAFATRSRVRQARAEVAKTEFAKIRLEESVAMEVRGAWDNLATLEASVAAQKENVDFAERGLAIAQARYDAGLMSNLEVLDAQSALTQAEMGYFTALRDYELAKFAMSRARGDLAEATFE